MTAGIFQVIRRLANMEIGSDVSDGHLLERFFCGKEDDAFRVLIKRHGPMVLGVCRRILQHSDDAEDAFQATFLVLVRKGRAFLTRDTIGNWLYGVAYHTALKARTMAAKRRQKETQLNDVSQQGTAAEESWKDLVPLLDQELSQLPEKYREAVVLCELEGKSRKEAAGFLGIPEGTLSSRLATARQMLEQRLKRHSQVLVGGALSVALTKEAAAGAVPPALATCTLKAASLMAAGAGLGTGIVSVQVATLTGGVLKAMFLSKLKCASLLILALGVLTAGGLGAIRTLSPGVAQAQTKDKSPAEQVIDRVEIGNAEAEKKHNLKEEGVVQSGTYAGKAWRHARNGGSFSYDMKILPDAPMTLVCTYWGSDKRRTFDILVDGKKIATQTVNNNKPNEFFEVEYKVPTELTQKKDKVTVKFQAQPNGVAGGLYGCVIKKGK